MIAGEWVLQNSAVAPDEALAALGTTQQNASRRWADTSSAMMRALVGRS
jgi:hypothetical protein